MTRIGCLLLLSIGACTVGDATGGDDNMMGTTKKARAMIAPTTGNTVTGMAEFTLSNGTVSLSVSVSMAPPGMHGFHIHQNPACGADGMDAGPHWGGAMAGDAAGHGLPESPTHHHGDVGNITVGADGLGTMSATSPLWTLGDGAATDVVPHAVIFHTAADDGTMPSAGARIGCGIIALVP
jgi:Cu-Zn family superoxide dismutase